MRKVAADLVAGQVIVGRFPGLLEPVVTVDRQDGFVRVGMPAGWQPIRLRADEPVEVLDVSTAAVFAPTALTVLR